MLKEARALTINGAFIHQCILSSIESIQKLCSSGASKEEIMLGIPCCTEGFYATKSAEEMESFIQRYLPPDYQHTLTTFANLSNKNDVMGYVDQISEDYKSTKKSSRNSSSRDGGGGDRADDGGVQMELIFVNEDGNDRHVFSILSSSTLKEVFTEYSEKRGVSLRSLRFSSDDKTLFLSQVGKRTLEEIGMTDQNVIVVHDLIKQDKKDINGSNNQKEPPSQGKKKQRAKKAKKVRKQKVVPIKIEKTEEELKIEVSRNIV